MTRNEMELLTLVATRAVMGKLTAREIQRVNFLIGYINRASDLAAGIEGTDRCSVVLLERRFEMLARAECRRQQVAPDEIVADGGHMAWQLVGFEAAQKEARFWGIDVEHP